MQALLKALWTDESGQDTTEYVLLVALIALAVTAGMILLADSSHGALLGSVPVSSVDRRFRCWSSISIDGSTGSQQASGSVRGPVGPLTPALCCTGACRRRPGGAIRRLNQEVVMQTLLKALWTDESGQDTTEYVLLVALIALAVTAGMILLADNNINEAFSAAGSTLDSHTP